MSRCAEFLAPTTSCSYNTHRPHRSLDHHPPAGHTFPGGVARSAAVAHGGVQVPVESGDHVEGDLLGAGGGAFADVGAAAESFGVVLGGHRHDPGVAFGL